MSRRTEGRRRNLSRPVVSCAPLQLAVEPLEGRRLLSVGVQGEGAEPFRIVGITGNQQSDFTSRAIDETLFDINIATPTTDKNLLLDGFTDPDPNDAFVPVLTPVTDIGVPYSPIAGIRQGSGALRVEVPQSSFWGVKSPNVIDLLKAGITNLSFDITFIGKELNGGSFGPPGSADNSFNGYAQSNEISVQTNVPGPNGWIQRNFGSGLATDDFNGTPGTAQWNGADGTHHITWDLGGFISGGLELVDFLTVNNATEAYIWFVCQGADSNGSQGPMRFYIDNVQLTQDDPDYFMIGDFDPVYTRNLVTLPWVPDTDAIAYNPDNGLLYRTSGSSSYRDNPTSIAYNDNHFLQTVDLRGPGPDYPQAGIFNANYPGDGANGQQGLPAPRPNFVLPAERRTPEQSDPTIGDLRGPGEYHAMRDFTWSDADNAFYGSDELGLFRLTPTGQSTFIGKPVNNPKGITFFTVGGQRRLLIAEQSGNNLWTVNTDGTVVGGPLPLVDAKTEAPMQGILSLIETPNGELLGIRGFRTPEDDGLPFIRELVRIDLASGEVHSIGALQMHFADLAVLPAPAGATVTEVYVRGSTWLGQDNNPATTNFMEYLEAKGLGDDVMGYRLMGAGRTPPASNPDDVIPWINADQIVVRYATAPTGGGIPTPGTVTVTGRNPAASAYTVTAVTQVPGDPTAYVLTLGKPLGGGDPVAGTAPTVDENGDYVRLGVPGGGPGGGNFSLTMNVLQGDTDHLGETSDSHAVLARDFAEVKKKFFAETGSPVTGTDTDYTPFHDVDGSGSILARDFAEVKKRFFQVLPPTPTAAAAFADGTSITQDVFRSAGVLH